MFDGGLRGGQTAAARAAYDSTVATYRQTVLTGFQEVEDNLAALRILEEEAKVQDEAVKAARLSVTLSTNQYKAGTINTLDLLVVVTVARNNERTADHHPGQPDERQRPLGKGPGRRLEIVRLALCGKSEPGFERRRSEIKSA